jgi:hypothetical protein
MNEVKRQTKVLVDLGFKVAFSNQGYKFLGIEVWDKEGKYICQVVPDDYSETHICDVLEFCRKEIKNQKVQEVPPIYLGVTYGRWAGRLKVNRIYELLDSGEFNYVDLSRNQYRSGMKDLPSNSHISISTKEQFYMAKEKILKNVKDPYQQFDNFENLEEPFYKAKRNKLFRKVEFTNEDAKLVNIEKLPIMFGKKAFGASTLNKTTAITDAYSFVFHNISKEKKELGDYGVEIISLPVTRARSNKPSLDNENIQEWFPGAKYLVLFNTSKNDTKN